MALEVSAAMAGRAATGVADFAVGFLVAGALVAAAAPFFTRLGPDAGAAVSGHGVRPGV